MKTARPFHVSTFGLAPDMKRVHPAFGTINRGEVSPRTLAEVLEIYRQIETDFPPSASYMAIQSNLGRFIVRVSGKQLTFGAEEAPPAEAVPLAAAAIMTRLQTLPAAPLTAGPATAPVEPPWRVALAVGLFVAGVALMGLALKPVLVPEKPRLENGIMLLRDGGELKTQQQALAGIFATGQQQGDRNLAISAIGQIVFAEVGPRHGLSSGADSFRIGRRDNQLCLVTVRNGVIDVVNANTLRYYGDTYRRLEKVE